MEPSINFKDLEEFDEVFLEKNSVLKKQQAYIRENQADIILLYNPEIKEDINVRLTFNDKLRSKGQSLSLTKRGRPLEKIEFVKNSSLFDNFKIDENWREKDERKWKEVFKNKERQEQMIEAKLAEIQQTSNTITSK